MALTNGADPNFIRDGRTPLLHLVHSHVANRCVDIDSLSKMISLLLKHGASIYGDSGNGSSIARMLFKKSFILETLGGTGLYACLLYFLKKRARQFEQYDKIMQTVFSSSFILFGALMGTAWVIHLGENLVYYPIIAAIMKEKYWKQILILVFLTGHFSNYFK